MKLWLISQTARSDYDTYDSAVVAAETEDEARQINPDGEWPKEGEFRWEWGSWCRTPAEVTVKHIGDAAEGVERGVVLASFNAG